MTNTNFNRYEEPASDYVVRFGELKDTVTEPSEIEITVEKVFRHENYE